MYGPEYGPKEPNEEKLAVGICSTRGMVGGTESSMRKRRRYWIYHPPSAVTRRGGRRDGRLARRHNHTRSGGVLNHVNEMRGEDYENSYANPERPAERGQ